MKTAEEIIAWAVDRFGDHLALSTSLQKGGMIVLDIAIRLQPSLRVFTLDTGRLPQETYAMIEAVRRRYGVNVESIHPNPVETERMVELHGPNLFFDDRPSRMLCCQVRKVRPMARILAESGNEIHALLAGLRRDQSETREAIDQIDETGKPVKINPLAYWSNEDVDRYTAEHDLPVHPLYAKGYTSIGCEPCTRATLAGEEIRAGRWWWESEGGKECGIHFTPDGRAQRTVDVMLEEIVRNT
jgi:phosphoadenylyl-sulfate reductase (thioredoxin)